jgi:hypothetical protein
LIAMADPFSRSLDALGTFPERTKIEAIVMLAMDAAGDPGAVAYIAGVVLDKLLSAPAPRKLPLL